jgi:lipoprotein NlpD
MNKGLRIAMLSTMNRFTANRYWYWLPLGFFTASMMLAGCGTMQSSVVVEPAAGNGGSIVAPAARSIPGGSYQVIKGDTLYSIAFRNGVDFRNLAQWNAVAAPYTIHPGQRLRLSPAASAAGANAAGSIGSATASTPVPVPVTVTPPAHVASSAPVTPAPMFEPVATPAAGSSSAKPASATSNASTTATASPPKSAAPAPATTTTVVPVAGVATPPPALLPPPAPPQSVAGGPSRAVSGVTWRWPATGALIKRFQIGDAIPGIEIAGNAGDPVRAAADGVVVYSGNGLVGYGELVIIKHSDSFLSAYGHNSKRLVKEGQRVTAGQQIAEMGSTGTTRNELEFQIRKDGNPVDPLGYLPPH